MWFSPDQTPKTPGPKFQHSKDDQGDWQLTPLPYHSWTNVCLVGKDLAISRARGIFLFSSSSHISKSIDYRDRWHPSFHPQFHDAARLRHRAVEIVAGFVDRLQKSRLLPLPEWFHGMLFRRVIVCATRLTLDLSGHVYQLLCLLDAESSEFWSSNLVKGTRCHHRHDGSLESLFFLSFVSKWSWEVPTNRLFMFTRIFCQ